MDNQAYTGIVDMLTKLSKVYRAIAGNCVSNTKAGMNEGFVV